MLKLQRRFQPAIIALASLSIEGLLEGAVLPRLSMQVLGDGEERMKGRRNPEKLRILDRGDRQAREGDEAPHHGVAEPGESDAGATRRYRKG